MAGLILATTAGSGNTASGLGLNYLYPLQPLAGRSYLTVRGTSLAGGIEMSTAEADANGNAVGLIQFSDKNTTAADKRVAAIMTTLDGTTANNRGGAIQFLTKKDATSGLTARLTVSNAGSVYTPNLTLDDGAGKATFKAASVNVAGAARYHLYNNGGTAEWYFGQKSATSHDFTLSKNVAGSETDYFSVSSAGYAKTLYNVLDNGAGTATFMGVTTAGQVIADTAGYGVSPLTVTAKTTSPNTIKFLFDFVRITAGSDWTAIDSRIYRQVDSTLFQFLNLESAGNITADFTNYGTASGNLGLQAYNSGYLIKMVPYANSAGIFNPMVAQGDSVIAGGSSGGSPLTIVPWSGTSSGIKLYKDGGVTTKYNTLDDGGGSAIFYGAVHKRGGGDLLVYDQSTVAYKVGHWYNQNGANNFRADMNADSDGGGSWNFYGAAMTYNGNAILTTANGGNLATKAKISGMNNSGGTVTLLSVTGAGAIDCMYFYGQASAYPMTINITVDGTNIFSYTTGSNTSLVYWNGMGSTSSTPIPAGIKWKSSCVVTVALANISYSGYYGIQYALA